MSTFGGLMVEYPQIAIDRFQGPAVLRAQVYFLSHAHADHMVGLDSKQFAQRLRLSCGIKLYCSEVTHQFLLTDRRFVHLADSLVSLPIEEPTRIALCNEPNEKVAPVLVTLLPAGHCPGSVMFLFEGSDDNVLYTGDFRLAKGEVARMTYLHSGNKVKDIKSVYADTTFCIPEAMHIPSREQSRDALLDLVEKQITKSPTHMVRLACRAKYGYEYLFVEISKEFNLKVHVSPLVMAQYKRVPELAAHLTTDGGSTQVHACRYVDCSMPAARDVLVVAPSTMWFTSNAKPSDVLKKIGHRYRLCFSFHSSFSEVRDFLGYIRPCNIYANVIPYNCTEDEIYERLEDLKREAIEIQTSQALTYKPLGQLKRSSRTTTRRIVAATWVDDDSGDDLFDDSPPPKKKSKTLQARGRAASGQTNLFSGVSEESGDCPAPYSQKSYLAMDDSDLSSGELDLYDSAPTTLDRSQEPSLAARHETETSLEESHTSGVGSERLDGRDAHGEVLESTGGVGKDRVSLESKIDSWLRYLPGANPRLEEDEMQKGEVEKEEEKEEEEEEEKNSAKMAEERLSDAPRRDIFASPTAEGSSPEVRSRETHELELSCSQVESDRTDEYSFSNSQELSLPPPSLLHTTDSSVIHDHASSELAEKIYDNGRFSLAPAETRIPVVVSADPNRVTFDTDGDPGPGQHQGVLSGTLSRPVQDSLKSGSGTTSIGSAQIERRGRDCQTLGLAESAAEESPVHSTKDRYRLSQLHRDASLRKNEGHAHHPRRGDDRAHDGSPARKIPREVETPPPLRDSLHWEVDGPQAADELSPLSARPSIASSQETFLPSSQDSAATRCSSDFDVPCTPEDGKLPPDQLEAIRTKVAGEETVPLVSCRRKMQLD